MAKHYSTPDAENGSRNLPLPENLHLYLASFIQKFGEPAPGPYIADLRRRREALA